MKKIKFSSSFFTGALTIVAVIALWWWISSSRTVLPYQLINMPSEAAAFEYFDSAKADNSETATVKPILCDYLDCAGEVPDADRQTRAIIYVNLENKKVLPVKVTVDDSGNSEKRTAWLGYYLEGDKRAVKKIVTSAPSASGFRRSGDISFLNLDFPHKVMVRGAYLRRTNPLFTSFLERSENWHGAAWNLEDDVLRFRLRYAGEVGHLGSASSILPAELTPLAAIDGLPLKVLLPADLPEPLSSLRRETKLEAEIMNLQDKLAESKAAFLLLDENEKVIPLAVIDIRNRQKEAIQKSVVKLMDKRARLLYAVTETVKDNNGEIIRHLVPDPEYKALVKESDRGTIILVPCGLWGGASVSDDLPQRCLLQYGKQAGAAADSNTKQSNIDLAAGISRNYLVFGPNEQVIKNMLSILSEHREAATQYQEGMKMKFYLDADRVREHPLMQEAVKSILRHANFARFFQGFGKITVKGGIREGALVLEGQIHLRSGSREDKFPLQKQLVPVSP